MFLKCPHKESAPRWYAAGVQAAFAVTIVCYTLTSSTGYYAFGSSVKVKHRGRVPSKGVRGRRCYGSGA